MTIPDPLTDLAIAMRGMLNEMDALASKLGAASDLTEDWDASCALDAARCAVSLAAEDFGVAVKDIEAEIAERERRIDEANRRAGYYEGRL